MAHSRFYQFRYSAEPSLVELFAVITIGASGACTLTRGKGIKSVTKDSTGQYTIAFKENFNGLLGVDAMTQNSTGIPSATEIGIKTDNSTSATAPGVTLVTSAAGVAANPASGDILFVRFTLRNSSL